MLTGFSIIITPDGLKAYLQIPPKSVAFPSKEEIITELKNRGINTGIDEIAIYEIAQGKKPSGLIEIVKGISPKPGEAARIEILIDISRIGKPRELENGRVDYREIGSVVNVKKGESLALRIPPTPGVPGKSVFGKIIEPPLPHDVKLIVKYGTEISPDNENLLIAAIDGAMTIDNEGLIEVKNDKVIESDIDFSTGNICFSGDLTIRGTVRAGFNVDVEGNLHVYGNVEDAQVKAKGNVEIEGGVVGSGTGKIECTGSVKARHLENFSIKSGDNVIISEDALHSNIYSEKKIWARSIIGGSICAYGIECDSIGSTAETKTVLDIGRMHNLIDERCELAKKYVEQYEIFRTNNMQQFILVRDNMDSTGCLNEKNHDILTIIKNKSMESKKICDKIKLRIDAIDILEKTLGAISGITARNIFPNTIIKFGNGEKVIQDLIHDVKLFARS